ncbi:MAG TPA: hypothetical protein VIJ20_07140, partial [Solirubrobacteraceae bacterium]
TAVTVVIVAVGVAAGGGGFAWRRRGPHLDRPRRRWSLAALRTLLHGRLLLAAFVVVFGTYAIVGLVTFSMTPNVSWDAWAIWSLKATLLTDFSHLPAHFFTGHAYLPTHQDYPLLLPLLESMWFRFAGVTDTQAMHAELWLLLVGFVWSAAYLLDRRGARIVLWGPLLLVAALASGTFDQLSTAYADVPMALFAGLGFLLLGFWISRDQPADLALGVIFLGAAANIKNEALPAAVIALLVAALVVRRPRPHLRRNIVLAFAALAIIALPWRIWTAAHGVPADPDLPSSSALHLSYILGRTGRIGPAASALQAQLADQGTWSYIVPIGAALALGCFIWRVARRLAFFYLATAILIFVMYVANYCLSGQSLSWYLATSDTRVIDVIVFAALAAALQLPSEIEAASSQVRARHSAERETALTHRTADVSAV